MALTTSLHTALTGLSNSSRMLNVTGNNIANLNTTGFKRSRTSFQTSLTSTIQSASGPTNAHGGRNPSQVGHGTTLGGVTRDFSSGPLQPTGINTHMAIEGQGFFVVRDGNTQRYTRSGEFDLDREFNLVTRDGHRVQGYGIDENGQVMEGVLEDMRVPLGNVTLAEATTNVQMGGNLNAAGDVATQGSLAVSDALFSDAAATTAATAGDELANLFDGQGNGLFDVGDIITLQNVTKGGTQLPTRTFEVNADNTTDSDSHGLTLQDFTSFIESVTGIDTSVGGGVTVNPDGQIAVASNTGTVNGLRIDPSDIIVNRHTDTARVPFGWTNVQQADGESVRTTFAAHDSLGSEMVINVNMVLEDRDGTGTAWRYYIQSDDDPGLDRTLDTGVVRFDNNGNLVTDTSPTFTIDRAAAGADSPQAITLDFRPDEGTFSALADASSKITVLNQDGAGIGTLEDFVVAGDGVIHGIFSNSLTRALGQITMANFSNPQGLAEVGSNLFGTTINSGAAQVGAPGEGGLGRVVGSALEQSNVDLSEEFIDMIAATTGFSANSRVLSTSDRLIQELLNTMR